MIKNGVCEFCGVAALQHAGRRSCEKSQEESIRIDKAEKQALLDKASRKPSIVNTGNRSRG
jgi:hypothetical protein